MNLRVAVKTCLNRLRHKSSNHETGLKVGEANFRNLSDAYEVLFARFFGKISKNERRSSLLQRLLGTPPSEAYFIILSLEKTKKIAGDVCEFGVAQGETSTLIANEMGNFSTMLHLFDSFKGMPRPSGKGALKNDIFGLRNIEAYKGTMSSPMEMVVARLKEIKFPASRYVIHSGFIKEPALSGKSLPWKVSFAYVDLDFYDPIKLALEFLDKVTVKGSIVIVDDYDFFSTGSKLAVDEFISKINKSKKRYKIFIPNKTFGCFAVITKL